MDIPVNKTFNISYVSAFDGAKYEGTFICKKLKIRDNLKLAIKKSTILEGFTYDEFLNRGLDRYYDSLAEAVALCDCAIVKAPDWWKDPLDLEDIELLWTVHKEVAATQAAIFRPEQSQQTSEADQQAAEGVEV